MGPERRARERKRAAVSCRALDSFLPPAKRNRSTSDSAHSIPAASTELEVQCFGHRGCCRKIRD